MAETTRDDDDDDCSRRSVCRRLCAAVVDTQNHKGGITEEPTTLLSLAMTALLADVSPSTSYELATEKGVSNSNVLKQGHTFFGVCCDMRRAVIIVNTIHASLAGMLLMSLLVTGATFSDDSSWRDSSNVFVLALQVVYALLGIHGACTYRIDCVFVAALSFVVEGILSLVFFNAWIVVYSACFAYPHFFFIHEIRKGIMSEANYRHERQSCCCV